MEALKASLKTTGKNEPTARSKGRKTGKESGKAETKSWLSVRQYIYQPCIPTRSTQGPSRSRLDSRD